MIDGDNPDYTAVPKSMNEIPDVENLVDPIEYGEMNEEEAREAGYVGKDGLAIDRAKKDVSGFPTGAYTDIGAGRSSVVHKH